MSTLTFCTLTGTDDSIDPSDLLRLSAQYDFAEWGVLNHQANRGKGRFPTFKWIDALCSQMSSLPSAHFALHICGRDAIDEFLLGVGNVSRLAAYFPRIQLNLVASNVDPESLIAAIQRHPDKTIITQQNQANKGLWQLLAALPNHAVLFDESGGLGISPATWPSCLPGKLCGYAGGLSPDNLATELSRIQSAAGGSQFWIDMEGKLRNQSDRFDLSRAQRCLAVVREVIEDFRAGQRFPLTAVNQMADS